MNLLVGENKKQVYTYEYPRPSVTTDCVVFGFDGTQLGILLIERGIEPFKGKWALPGGFLRMDETAEEGAKRELLEETGVDNIFIEQIGCYSDVNRDPRGRVITIAFNALVRQSDYQIIGGDDAASAKWFSMNEVPSLAFDHDHILRDAFKRLKERIHFEPIGFHLLDEKFTMSELQTIYESILEVHFDRRNFQKKLLTLGYLIQLNEKRIGTAHRAPTLFKFDKEAYDKAKKLGMRLEF